MLSAKSPISTAPLGDAFTEETKMPELPEVQTIVTGLNRLIQTKKIAAISWNWAKSFPNPASGVDETIGASIVASARRGKAILIHLDQGSTLLIHLKMTGQLVFQPAGQDGPFPNQSTRVRFDFSDGSSLFFNDFRKFGWIKILPRAELEQDAFLSKLGPDPLKQDFTAARLKDRLGRRKGTIIKAALLDQTVLAGIGNIYCDEALFLAGIMPDRRVHSLTEAEIRKLHRSIRKVLRQSIELGGSTVRNYLDAEGIRGHYLDQALVYGRNGEPCPICGSLIQKMKVAGRGTHVCTGCQK